MHPQQVADPAGRSVRKRPRQKLFASPMGQIRSRKGEWPATVLAPASRRASVYVDGTWDRRRTSIDPELSLVRGEWYFTIDTCRRFAALRDGATLLAGTPTLAEHIGGATLVETSPWAPARLDLSSVTHINVNFEEYWTDSTFDTIMIDPPWYFPALTNWINNAAYFSHSGTLIAFPLFGVGTRPNAYAERNLILSTCESMGAIRVLEDFVEYETPLFEVEALAVSGIQMEGPWRVSDCVLLTVERPPTSLMSIGEQFEWDEFRVGSQILSVRTNAPSGATLRQSHELIEEVPGTVHWTLDSVSRRDERWQYICVCTSRNRVAYASSLDRVRRAARELASSNLDRVRGIVGSPTLSDDASTLEEWLER